MQPLLDEAAGHKADVVDLKEKLKRFRKHKAAEKVLEVLDAQIREKEKAPVIWKRRRVPSMRLCSI